MNGNEDRFPGDLMNIESRWRLLAFWSAKDVPQVHWRRLQVMLKKKQASKPRKQVLYRCCAAGPVDWGSNQSTGGTPGALCTRVHRYQSTDCTVQSTGDLPESLGSRLGLRPVNWFSPRSSSCTGAVDCCRRAVDWWDYPRVWAVDCL